MISRIGLVDFVDERMKMIEFDLEVLSPASREAKQTQRESAGIAEFHHEQHVHDMVRFGCQHKRVS